MERSQNYREALFRKATGRQNRFVAGENMARGLNAAVGIGNAILAMRERQKDAAARAALGERQGLTAQQSSALSGEQLAIMERERMNREDEMKREQREQQFTSLQNAQDRQSAYERAQVMYGGGGPGGTPSNPMAGGSTDEEKNRLYRDYEHARARLLYAKQTMNLTPEQHAGIDQEIRQLETHKLRLRRMLGVEPPSPLSQLLKNAIGQGAQSSGRPAAATTAPSAVAPPTKIPGSWRTLFDPFALPPQSQPSANPAAPVQAGSPASLTEEEDAELNALLGVQ